MLDESDQVASCRPFNAVLIKFSGSSIENDAMKIKISVLQSIYLKTGFLTLRTFNFAIYPCCYFLFFFSYLAHDLHISSLFLIFPSPD